MKFIASDGCVRINRVPMHCQTLHETLRHCTAQVWELPHFTLETVSLFFRLLEWIEGLERADDIGVAFLDTVPTYLVNTPWFKRELCARLRYPQCAEPMFQLLHLARYMDCRPIITLLERGCILPHLERASPEEITKHYNLIPPPPSPSLQKKLLV